jgi:flagellin
VINENGVETLRLLTTTTTSSSSDSVNRWWIQCGAQNGVGVFLEIDAISARQLGVVGLDVTTFQKASSAMDTISTAVDLVSAARSKIGAQQNRLEHTIANEDNIVENMTDAESRIRDADMAEEMTAYSTANIIAQAVEAMIAQANSSTEGILTLLG